MTRGIIYILLWFSSSVLQAVLYDTQQLEKLAGMLNLRGLDSLPVGVSNDYTYSNHPLTVRKNEWGEIEHIGLLLFSRSLRESSPSLVYDFLERYLLLRLAVPANAEERVKLQGDHFSFSVGFLEVVLQIDTTTAFTEECIDLRSYRTAWLRGTNKLLEVTFDMDCQLMWGCDAVELENRMMRHLARFRPDGSGGRYADSPALPVSGLEYTLSDSYYMSPMIRDDVYYTRREESQPWELVNSRKRPVQTIANWMVARDSENELPLRLVVDRYGYQADSLQMNYRAWQQWCVQEGCTPYFGVKAKRDDAYLGTVFMVNRRGGYLHLLRIDIPVSALTDMKSAVAAARCYAYIPLHNVDALLIRSSEYIPVR